MRIRCVLVFLVLPLSFAPVREDRHSGETSPLRLGPDRLGVSLALL
jgi:hypothetical protein